MKEDLHFEQSTCNRQKLDHKMQNGSPPTPGQKSKSKTDGFTI